MDSQMGAENSCKLRQEMFVLIRFQFSCSSTTISRLLYQIQTSQQDACQKQTNKFHMYAYEADGIRH